MEFPRHVNFQKIAKFTCREIRAPQNREINVSRKNFVLRYLLIALALAVIM